MIKNKDIIIISIQAWDIEIGSNCKNIALEFAKNNRVLYVNPPLDRITRIRQKNLKKVQKRIRISKGLDPDLKKIGPNLWNLQPKNLIESINWIKLHSLFNVFNKRNAKIFSNDINTAISRLGFSNFILFNDSSMFLGLHLKKYLMPEIYAYYIRDNLIKVPYWKKHGKIIEPKTIKIADVILNNSSYYKEYGQQFNLNCFMVGQGCDTTKFNDIDESISIPEEYQQIPSPKIGYVGSITSLRLDPSILENIAREKPNWNIILVGPEDKIFKNSPLHDLPNVHFLGSKKSDDLPSHIKGFDIAINPQAINDITIGNYPRKIDEYLAMGKPVIATRTIAMEMFKDYVYLAKNKKNYVQLIEIALKEDSKIKRKERIDFANSHTWENNVKNIYKALLTTNKEILWKS